MTESRTELQRGPATPPAAPVPRHHAHLWNRHLETFKTADIVGGGPSGMKAAFRDARRGTDYLPVGQWLVAMDRCQQGHAWQMFGDPCPCGSDNCDYCARCGVEHHD